MKLSKIWLSAIAASIIVCGCFEKNVIIEEDLFIINSLNDIITFKNSFEPDQSQSYPVSNLAQACASNYVRLTKFKRRLPNVVFTIGVVYVLFLRK